MTDQEPAPAPSAPTAADDPFDEMLREAEANPQPPEPLRDPDDEDYARAVWEAEAFEVLSEDLPF